MPTSSAHKACARLFLLLFLLLLLLLLTAMPATADISGTVVESGTFNPIAGARVHAQADPSSPVAITAADGSFTLVFNPPAPVFLTAGVEYDHASATNWTTQGTPGPVANGTVGVQIQLFALPVASNPSYDPPTVSDSCSSCHEAQAIDWETSNHAGAAVDTWVLDLHSGTGTPGGSAGYVFTATHDPGETGFCATCHAPLADVFDPGNVQLNEVTDPAALEGVSCIGCHQIAHVNENVDALHHLGNSAYRFPDDSDFPTQQYVWGPLDDVSFGGMRASYAPIFSQSRFCASCHQYTNPDTGAPGQNTYGEWLASPFAVPGPGFRTCQDCHMLEADPGPICTQPLQPDRPSPQNRRHTFPGATPERLASSLSLATVASDAGGFLDVSTDLTSIGIGHSFPTGIAIRNAMVLIEATWNGQPLAQVDGPTIPFYGSDEVPGVQPGDHAGMPGKGYAKVLEGRINGQGPVVRPVLFIDAESVWADTLLPSETTDTVAVRFQLPQEAEPGDVVEVTARLLYRRAWRALAVTKGWTETPQGGPIEVEVHRNELQVVLIEGGPGSVVDIPALGAVGLGVLALVLGWVGVWVLRRR